MLMPLLFSPVEPMGVDAIEKMAARQLKDDDYDEDVDDEDLENDAELLVSSFCCCL